MADPVSVEAGLDRIRQAVAAREEGVQRDLAHRRRSGMPARDNDLEHARRYATVGSIRLDDLQALLALLSNTSDTVRVREAAQFLADRLDELEWMDGEYEETFRNFVGHVDPAHARLKSALSASTIPDVGEGS